MLCVIHNRQLQLDPKFIIRFIRFIDFLRYIFERASIGISTSIYDWSGALVRISFQGVASAVLWESWNPKIDQRERERVCAPRICVGRLFGKFKGPRPFVLTNFPLLRGYHKKWFSGGRGEKARAAAPGNVIKIYYTQVEDSWRGLATLSTP